MSNVKKPITLAVEDFMSDIVNVINNSGLPYFVVENVLKDCVKEVHSASQKQLEIDRAQYLEELNKVQSIDKGEDNV